jgi:hypothetical protein
MSTDKIPYTHWAYFPDEASARRCANDLQDYVIRIRRSVEGADWLLLAGRDVEIGGMVERHQEVEAIVERHGGLYDGGESTWDPSLGKAVVDPLLTGDWGAGKDD